MEVDMTTKEDATDVIFRRFRRTKSGQILDAYKYGLKGWPIKVRKSNP